MCYLAQVIWCQELPERKDDVQLTNQPAVAKHLISRRCICDLDGVSK